jgi:hypothetical protein
MKNFFSRHAKELREPPAVGFIDFGVEARAEGHKPFRMFCRVRADYLAHLRQDLEAAEKNAELGAVCVVITEQCVQVEGWTRSQFKSK